MRKPVSSVRKDKSVFTHTAKKIKAINLPKRIPRGGIRF